MRRIITLLIFSLCCHAGYSQAWKSLAPDIAPIGVKRGAAFAINGKGYIFGGDYFGNDGNMWAYDTLTNAWSHVATYPSNAVDGIVGCSYNGMGYAGTGTYTTQRTNVFYKYDPVADTWTPLPNFPGGIRSYAVIFVLDGKIYLGGGTKDNSNSSPYKDFYVFDPVSETWNTTPIALCPALGVSAVAAAFVIGDKAYVGTGTKDNSSLQSVPQKDFWEYDTISKVWTRVADFPGGPRGEASAFATCDKGYVGLGFTDSLRTYSENDFWEYDPAKNKWTRIADYGGSTRTAAYAFAIGKTGYVGGGCPTPAYNPVFHDLWSYTATYTPAITSSPDTICAGQSVSFTDTSNYSPTNWQWSFQGGTPNSSNQQNPVIEYDTAGVYDVSLSAWNSCDSAGKTFSQYITVGAGGALSVTANPSAVCSGQTSALTVAPGTGTYAWLPAVGLTDSTSASITVSPTVTTTYTVTALGGVCASTGQVILMVANNTIAGTVTAVRDTICQYTPGNLTLTGNSSSAIQWQSAINDTAFTNATNDTLVNYKTNPLAQTTWYRAIVGTGSCSAISDTLRLFVPPPLTAYFNDTLAAGNNVVAFNSDSSSGAIRSYHWDFGDNQTSTEENPQHTYTNTKDTTYYVCLTLYDGSNCSYTFCRYLNVSAETGVYAVPGAGDWIIYPDPFTNQLTISATQSNNPVKSIEMYNVLGQIVINISMNSSTNAVYLDVSFLAKGMYYLMLRTNNTNYVQKVIKQ